MTPNTKLPISRINRPGQKLVIAHSNDQIQPEKPIIEIGDLLVAYLAQLDIDFVFGVPGGAIEPLFNALARSERNNGPRAVVSRHENGGVFMADGYARNSGKLGICCTTTGPGATNAITGVATAYENNTPLLIITAQTALTNFGRKALQESADTGINTIGMFEHCSLYNTLISHPEQFEHKLVTAIMTALGSPKGPVHLSIPLDILRSPAPVSEPSFQLQNLIKTPNSCDQNAVSLLAAELQQAKKPVFVIGSDCAESIRVISTVAVAMDAKIVTSPDGKGLVSPYHPLYRGVIGFAGHDSASQLLLSDEVDLVIAVGTTLGEWASNGWDQNTLMNNRLIHIESSENNLTRSPMARLHVRGRILTIFEQIESGLREPHHLTARRHSDARISDTGLPFDMIQPEKCRQQSSPIKPQWLMSQLTKTFPPHSKFLADSGNSFAWGIHYLHPYDRRISERRHRDHSDNGRREWNGGLFQAAIEFAPMGWAIGSAIGAALASPNSPIVCITGDGSWLMSGQEITTALQQRLPVFYIILNDAALGMVKHGQRLAGAEATGFELPAIDYAAMAIATGANGFVIETPQDLLNINVQQLISQQRPTVLDVRIDPEEVPPIDVRMKVLLD
jgi:acetolactate synthase-1/2/3 large subunit